MCDTGKDGGGTQRARRRSLKDEAWRTYPSTGLPQVMHTWASSNIARGAMLVAGGCGVVVAETGQMVDDEQSRLVVVEDCLEDRGWGKRADGREGEV